jgi:hypothetical protein
VRSKSDDSQSHSDYSRLLLQAALQKRNPCSSSSSNDRLLKIPIRLSVQSLPVHLHSAARQGLTMLLLPAHQWWFVRSLSASVSISLAATNSASSISPSSCPLQISFFSSESMAMCSPSLRDHKQGQSKHARSPKSRAFRAGASCAFIEPGRISNQTSSGASVTGRGVSFYSRKRQNGGGSSKWTQGTEELCYIQNAKPNTQRCPQRSQSSPRYPLPKPTHARMPEKTP